MEFNNNKGEYLFPYDIKWVDKDTTADLLKNFKGEKTGFVQVGEEKWFFPSKFKDNADHFYNFQSRPDDVWVATFPRSGTTWTQELVWMIVNNLDYEAAQATTLNQRFPFFEFGIFMHDETKKELLDLNSHSEENQKLINDISVMGHEFFPQMQKQRFLKTHFPFPLLPPSVMEVGAKVVYVARNPRDVAVSYYHLNRLYRTQGYIGNFPDYWNYFEKGLAPWCPYWSHIKEGWKHRNHPNVLFMFYEDMNRDLKATIRKVSSFFNKNYSEEEIEKLADYLDIKNFKNNKAVNCEDLKRIKLLNSGEEDFVRSGKSDGWSNEYTPGLKEHVKRWIEENSKDLEFQFPVTF